MPLSKPAIQRLMFAFICFVWGTNWVAMKVGVSAVPPGYFSGTRWAFAGLVLLACSTSDVSTAPERAVHIDTIRFNLQCLNGFVQ